MSKALRRSIYMEHLEECAMLFERRWLCREDPESSLADIAELDARMEAHIDGLVLGGELATQLCLDALAEGDPPDVHAVARVLCRGEDPELLALFEPVLALGEDGEDDEGPTRAQALGAALDLELAPAWAAKLRPMLERGPLAPLLVHAAGCRGIAGLGDALIGLLARPAPELCVLAARALGKLRHRPALAPMRRLLGGADSPALWSALAIACLELGDSQVAGLLRSSAELARWSPLGQVLSFDVPATWLLDALEHGVSEELVVALALRGDSLAFASLLELLGDPTHARLAAGALFTITGAPLLEHDPELEVAPPQQQGGDEDEAPEPGWMRLCSSVDTWRAWIDADPGRWPAGHPRRLGQPVDLPVSACAALCCALPVAIREAILDELTLRFGVEAGPRTSALAQAQLDALRPRGARVLAFDRKELRA